MGIYFGGFYVISIKMLGRGLVSLSDHFYHLWVLGGLPAVGATCFAIFIGMISTPFHSL